MEGTLYEFRLCSGIRSWRLSRPRLFSALSLAALMVHQFEEYNFPGYFPGMIDGGIFRSDKPERYP